MTDSAQSATKQGIDPWEAEYLRFETQEEEIRKFTERLRRLGVGGWPRETKIVELFCGRGNGLHALARLGFRNLEGVDLSPRLPRECRNPKDKIAGIYLAVAEGPLPKAS
jgi:hypothetical protein